MTDEHKCYGWHCAKRSRCARYGSDHTTSQLFFHVRPWDECPFYIERDAKEVGDDRSVMGKIHQAGEVVGVVSVLLLMAYMIMPAAFGF